MWKLKIYSTMQYLKSQNGYLVAQTFRNPQCSTIRADPHSVWHITSQGISRANCRKETLHETMHHGNVKNLLYKSLRSLFSKIPTSVPRKCSVWKDSSTAIFTYIILKLLSSYQYKHYYDELCQFCEDEMITQDERCNEGGECKECNRIVFNYFDFFHLVYWCYRSIVVLGNLAGTPTASYFFLELNYILLHDRGDRLK